MRLKELLEGIEFFGEPEECEITHITHDSRKVRPGTLFVAIKGFNNDGHDFILDAVHKGAIAVMSNGRSLSNIGVPVIRVNDPRESMSKLAANFFQHPSRQMNVVGVTGTNGKTTITHILKHLLSHAGVPCGTLGTLGFSTPSGMISTGFTTPESVDLHQFFSILSSGGINTAVMEVSSHALELHRVDDVHFDIAVFTNLTHEHLDYHRTMEKYFQAKLKLFKSLDKNKTAILNLDDPYGKKITRLTSASVVTYGFTKQADIYPEKAEFSLDGTYATLNCRGNKIRIQTPFIGKYNLSNIMAAVAALLKMGIHREAIETGFTRLPAVPGRLEFIPIHVPGRALIDYAHTPDAYQKVLSMIREMAGESVKLITLFGCGGGRDHSKRPLMGRIASELSHKVIITSDNPRFEDVQTICAQITSGISGQNYRVIPDRKEALNYGMSLLDENCILIIFGKGRENFEIVQGEKIPHSDVAVIQEYRR